MLSRAASRASRVQTALRRPNLVRTISDEATLTPDWFKERFDSVWENTFDDGKLPKFPVQSFQYEDGFLRVGHRVCTRDISVAEALPFVTSGRAVIRTYNYDSDRDYSDYPKQFPKWHRLAKQLMASASWSHLSYDERLLRTYDKLGDGFMYEPDCGYFKDIGSEEGFCKCNYCGPGRRMRLALVPTELASAFTCLRTMLYWEDTPYINRELYMTNCIEQKLSRGEPWTSSDHEALRAEDEMLLWNVESCIKRCPVCDNTRRMRKSKTETPTNKSATDTTLQVGLSNK